MYLFISCIYVYVSSLMLSSEDMYVNGVFNETWTHSCFQFKWFLVMLVFFKVVPFFFLEGISLCLLYNSFAFDISNIVGVVI